MTALGDANMLVELTREGAIGALDWWWAYTGSQLPNLTMFAKIADAAVVSSSLLVVEWWWTRFLEHRTPEHKFGMPRMAKELCFFNHVGILDWYGQRYKESRDQELSYFPRPLSGDSNELGVDFVLKSPPSLPIMQWAVEKCAEMDGQKLTLMPGFTSACASNGRVDLLDYALSSAEYLVMDWHDDLVAQAVESGQIEMLEWWDRNRGALPPQDLNCSSYLSRATLSDAVDVLAWWHAHRFPASKADWQQVCIEAIKNDASYVQLWLLDRLDLFAPDTNEELIVFTNACMSVLLWAKPFTYDFVRTAFPDLDMSVWIPVADHAYSCLTTLYFWCGFCNITVTSLLPLKPTILDTLLKARSVAMIEWWLQLHLAAGHPFVLPTARKLNEIYRRCKISHQWVYDVTVVRKLPVFVESEVGVVPYTSPPPPFPPPF
ncbi:hypothetical protein BC828DRAFT_391552 [Blastocladiella britannica]|nr:hypothetical protein BC828DRAFT_391552 [Blastocladiella britannica]